MLRTILAAAAFAATALPAAAGGGCVGQCYRATWVPPTYEMQAERVLVQAPQTYAYVTPAAYKTVHETVMVDPGSKRWVVQRDAWGNKIGCWVKTPPRYATVPRTVMVRGPEVVPVSVPAQYGVRMTSVMTQPGHKTWVPVGHGHGHGGYAPY